MGEQVYAASYHGKLQTVITAGGLTILDAAALVNPTTQITNDTRQIVVYDAQQCQRIAVVARYAAAATTASGVSYRVFGRHNSTDPWIALPNLAGATTGAVTFSVATDASDGTLRVTTPDIVNDVWDRLGRSEILIGLSVIHAADSGAALASLMVLPI